MSKSRLIIGCGYLGRRVADRWLSAGDTVHAFTRSAAHGEAFRAAGMLPIIGDVTKPNSLSDLPEVDTLLFAVGYDRTVEGPSIEEVYAVGFQNVLNALNDRAGRVIYISTTGVYGDAQGSWIDESTPTDPHRAGGKASLAAEQALAASQFAERGTSLRLAGIYGPDRLPYLQQISVGEPIAAPSKGWLNLIHVDDAAQAVIVTAEAESVPPLLCVSDGAPAERGAFYREVAQLMGAPAPQFVDPPEGSPRAARAAADKRVSNRQLIESLGIELRYPSYREGLAAILSGK